MNFRHILIPIFIILVDPAESLFNFHPIKGFLALMDTEINAASTILDSVSSALNLYRKHAPRYLFQCYRKHHQGYAEIFTETISNPINCTMEEIKLLEGDFGGSITDFLRVFLIPITVLHDFFHRQGASTKPGLIKLEVENLEDLVGHVVHGLKTVLDVTAIPKCIINHTKKLAVKINKELLMTFACVKQELAKSENCGVAS